MTGRSPAPLSNAWVVAVGSELLTGDKQDSHSGTIARALGAVGVETAARVVVGDDVAQIAALVTTALANADLAVVTGGLGPTDDDLTREGVAQALGLRLAEDPAVVAWLERLFAARGRAMPEVNRRQAAVPEGADVLPNAVGTAPGLWIEVGDRAVLVLPGPTVEMYPMLEQAVADRIEPRSPGAPVRRRVVVFAGRGESEVEETIRPLYAGWTGAGILLQITTLAADGEVELHLSAQARDGRTADAALARAVAEVCTVAGRDVVSGDGRRLAEIVGGLLAERKWRIAVAESCTGGGLAARLTDVPGSSAYVDGGVVTYSDASKTRWLGVPATVLARHGAVSEPVAIAMAEGVRASAGVDVGVGITGIAGPGGGSETKPVGMVVIAIAGPDGMRRVVTRRFGGPRSRVRRLAVNWALDLVRRELLERR